MENSAFSKLFLWLFLWLFLFSRREFAGFLGRIPQIGIELSSPKKRRSAGDGMGKSGKMPEIPELGMETLSAHEREKNSKFFLKKE